jgi:hypothetical protein
MEYEVFKTNVENPEKASHIIQLIETNFPDSQVNFDLEDVDKIMRVKNSQNQIDSIIELIKKHDIVCEILKD